MIGRFRGVGGRLFPNRSLLLCSQGRVRSVGLPGWLQVVGLVATLTVFAGMGYLAAGYVHARKTLRHQSTALADLIHEVASTASAANDDLRRQLADAKARAEALRQRYAETNAQYESALQQFNAARQQLDEARQQLAATNSQLAQATNELTAARSQQEALKKAVEQEQPASPADGNAHSQARGGEMERTALRDRIKDREGEVKALDEHAQKLKQAVEAMDRQLTEMAFERDRLRNQIGEAPARAAATPALDSDNAGVPTDSANPPAAKPDDPHQRAQSSELERLIASTGIDIDRILGPLSLAPGQGGPYVALGSVKHATADEQKRIAELHKLVKTLPLEAPLAHYQLESGFGPRVDPINGRAAFHSGLDLAAPYKSSVYSTGPGIVSFTGVKEAYGRVVEIDHGHGITTRYAHLHRILVVRGQKVAAQQEIAQLGSTGRSTGPHVHYEILIDGIPQDPAKFMQVGKNVVQVSGQ
jgi:murein DD-endopeptidase MepM/ murein hydrolase activator NlpD